MPDGWIPEKMRGRSARRAPAAAGEGANSVVIVAECSRTQSPTAPSARRSDGSATIPPMPRPVRRSRRMSGAPLRVGVLGAGTVGREVVRALLERPGAPARRPTAPPLVLTGVAVRDMARAAARGLPPTSSPTRRPTSSPTTIPTSSSS